MAESTISWTDFTFNPWIGCEKVSPGCKFCYAEVFSGRYLRVQWGGKAQRHLTADSTWIKPYVWNRKAFKEGVRKRVFCASLADVFEDNPQLVQWRKRLWDVILATPHLDWLLLTKRPMNYMMFPDEWLQHGSFPQNIWLGTSICTQKEYDINWALLKSFQEAYGVRVSFVSFEPLLAGIKLNNGAPDWSIIGGESGFKKDARPMDLSWVKSMIDDIRGMNDKALSIFFKQLGTQLAKKLKIADMKGERGLEELPAAYDWIKVREIPFLNNGVIIPPEKVFPMDLFTNS